MNTKGIAIAAVFAILLAAAMFHPGLTLIQPGPVAIQSCSVIEYQRIHERPFWSPWGPGPIGDLVPITDGIEIRYINQTNRVADHVAFVVNYRGDVQHIVDLGTFSPGARIDHTFGDFTGDSFAGSNPNMCRVQAVRFADGSVWRNPHR